MNKHKIKIEKIFEHPISGNIDYHRVIAALEHYGATVDVSKQHRAMVHYSDKQHSITLSHRPELSKDSVTKLRHFLEEVGLTPDKLK